jgi:arylsulfatase A-like enzyme/Tfp pilus assembly protein PilF
MPRAVLVGALLVTLQAAAAAAPPTERPNLLLITIDTLRADALGCYGGRPETTPKLDQLAREGVRFESAYAHVPLTLPSHTSILTGRYPFEHGIRDNAGYRFDGRYQTLATVLHRRGYATAAFVSAFPLDRRFGLDAGFDRYDDRYGERSSWHKESIVERPAAATWAAAQPWLEQQRAGPWFLWLHFFDPHSPYEPPAGEPREIAGLPYLAEAHYADKIVGQVLAQIRARAEPTLVVVTADHGESLGEHGEQTHGIFAYDATLRVPWLMAGPTLPRGRVVKGLSRHIDVLPTLLELLRLDVPEGLPGKSLLAQVLSAAPTRIEQSYFEVLSSNLGLGWAPLRGVITWPYKFIDLPIAELYDLAKDPKETHNLAGEQPQQVRLGEAQVKKVAGATDDFRAGRQAISAEEQRRLEALGYVAGTTASDAQRVWGPEDDPKNLIVFESQLDHAVRLYMAGSSGEAVTELEDLIRRRPEMKEAHMQLALYHSELGHPERAAAVLRQAVQQGVGDVEVIAHCGLYLHEAGDSAAAAELLRTAVAADPSYADAHNFLGVVLAARGQAGAAQAQFEAVLALDPNDGEALLNLGSLSLSQAQPRRAIDYFDRALDQDPSLANAYNGKGVAWIQLGERHQALAAWQEAVRLDPTLWDALFNLGKLLLDGPNPQQALPVLRQFVAGAPRAKYARDIDFFARKISGLEAGAGSR